MPAASPPASPLRVCVLGLGYIDLPTAAVIARTGAQVLGVDISPQVVETVNSGRVHIEEVDLDGLVSRVVARGSLRAATQIEPAEVFVIAVPTPFGADHVPDIGYVLKAATAIATVLKLRYPRHLAGPAPASARHASAAARRVILNTL